MKRAPEMVAADTMIASLRGSGMTYAMVAATLNEEGMRTSKGTAWRGQLCQARHSRLKHRDPCKEPVALDDHEDAIDEERDKADELRRLLEKERAEHEDTKRAMRRLRLAALRQGAVL